MFRSYSFRFRFRNSYICQIQNGEKHGLEIGYYGDGEILWESTWEKGNQKICYAKKL